MTTPGDDNAAWLRAQLAFIANTEAEVSGAAASADGGDTVAAVGDGNAEALKRYWTIGPGGARIKWGTDGDLTRCHREVMQEVPSKDMTSDDVWGYCQNLHKRLFGVPNPKD
jgi:hypothetical protein